MKKHTDNKKKLTVMLISGFIVFSMVISIFAVIVDNQSNDNSNYNSHKIITTNTGYKTKINSNYQDFHYYPSELERINLDSGIITKLKNSQAVAFIFDPKENVTENLQYIDLIRYETGLQFDKPTYFGVTSNSTKYTLPIVTCDNATAEIPFILINISSNTSFTVSSSNPNCIIMNAKLKELLATKDRLIYTYYGIMK